VTIRAIHCECDYCGDTASYDEPGDEYEDGWFVVRIPPLGDEKCYCSEDCLEDDLLT
jgi:hypothetical protein